ncbi:MAG: Fic family protein [Betaproteobacteria bacterium]|nr:Fic family protein [Betaproteobacteria bacterium]
MPALRKYETSHPWLSFNLDLRQVSARLWIALGEAQSKCQHIAGVPLQPDTAAEMHRIYLARGLLATTAIEGNTLTEKEVRDLLDKKLKLPPSRQYLAQEIDNILSGFNGILKEIEAGRVVPLSTQLIKTFNGQVLHKLKLDSEVVPGQIRKHSVGVGTYRGAPAEDCEYLLDRLCEWLNSIEAPEGDEVIYGLIKSIVGHVYLAWIHPFGDGNGRTARLLEAKFLLEAGVPSAAAHLLSNHYNLTRTEYYRQLEQTSKTNGDLRAFMEYAVRGFVDQLREQISTIQSQQLMVSWINYVHEKFGAQKTAADRRQRDVVLAMSRKGVAFKVADIKQIDARIAAQYATKTPKTITRDMNRLRKLGLVESEPAGYRAKIEIMLAFLPTSLNRPAAKQAEAVLGDERQLELGLTLPTG